MSSTIRQFENAVNMLVQGALTNMADGNDAGNPEDLEEIVQALDRVKDKLEEIVEREEKVG